MENRQRKNTNLPSGTGRRGDHSPARVLGTPNTSPVRMDQSEVESESSLGTPEGDPEPSNTILLQRGNTISPSKGVDKLCSHLDRLMQRELEVVLELAGDNTIARDEDLIERFEVIRGKRMLIEEFIDDRRNSRRLF